MTQRVFYFNPLDTVITSIWETGPIKMIPRHAQSLSLKVQLGYIDVGDEMCW